MDDWARVRANFDFFFHCVMKSKSARSFVNLLQSLQSAIETSTLLFESLEGMFLLLVANNSYFRSTRDFVHAQCLDTLRARSFGPIPE